MRSRSAALLPLLLAGFAPPVLPLGIASWAPALLVLAGFIMLAVEVFVVPGFGVAGVIGLLGLLAGVVLAVLGPGLGAADLAIAMGAIVSSVTMIGVAGWAVASRLRAGHPLLGGVLSGEGYRAVPARRELEGAEGVAVTDLRPSGTAEILGERLDVVSEEAWIPAGAPVRVVHSEGWRLVVRALPQVGGGVPEEPSEDATGPEPR